MPQSKRRSHCVKIKKPVKCNRFKSCKYASGTKRKFCRKKKNHTSKKRI